MRFATGYGALNTSLAWRCTMAASAVSALRLSSTSSSSLRSTPGPAAAFRSTQLHATPSVSALLCAAPHGLARRQRLAAQLLRSQHQRRPHQQQRRRQAGHQPQQRHRRLSCRAEDASAAGVAAAPEVPSVAWPEAAVEEAAASEQVGSGVGIRSMPQLRQKYWTWRGYRIAYATAGEGPPVVLVHGFGASWRHWRANIPALAAAGYTVHALDLLGQGASEKPPGFAYTMETWREQVLDFVKEFVSEPAVLVGNSVGSLAVLMASAEAEEGVVRGTVLMNCAGGMNNKAVMDDWRLQLAAPVLALVDVLLKRPRVARYLFDKIRDRENIRQILLGVYANNKAAVDDELIDLIVTPASDSNAVEAFVSIITGPPGPRPEALIERVRAPLLLVWGDRDTFTPLDGPVGRFFLNLPAANPLVNLVILPGVGHCPHDDAPELVHAKLLPWLAALE
eukprot:jgi/Chlat1/2097/Chrsp17S02835